ncbi:unnamed protein product [Orchesella dallaii]|uniref:Uncharacterized protein n=1 Tax=Orchesella dallaii TaxID=48710 RepID=A0ABP1S304_9HEXA
MSKKVPPPWKLPPQRQNYFLSGQPTGFNTQFCTNPTGQPVEDDSEVELDPLEKLAATTWKPHPETCVILGKYLKRSLDKAERKTIVERFQIPAVPAAQLPKLETPVLQLLNQRKLGLKNIPGLLAVEAVESRMLDAIGPIAAVHAEAIKAKA